MQCCVAVPRGRDFDDRYNRTKLMSEGRRASVAFMDRGQSRSKNEQKSTPRLHAGEKVLASEHQVPQLPPLKRRGLVYFGCSFVACGLIMASLATDIAAVKRTQLADGYIVAVEARYDLWQHCFQATAVVTSNGTRLARAGCSADYGCVNAQVTVAWVLLAAAAVVSIVCLMIGLFDASSRLAPPVLTGDIIQMLAGIATAGLAAVASGLSMGVWGVACSDGDALASSEGFTPGISPFLALGAAVVCGVMAAAPKLFAVDAIPRWQREASMAATAAKLQRAAAAAAAAGGAAAGNAAPPDRSGVPPGGDAARIRRHELTFDTPASRPEREFGDIDELGAEGVDELDSAARHADADDDHMIIFAGERADAESFTGAPLELSFASSSLRFADVAGDLDDGAAVGEPAGGLDDGRHQGSTADAAAALVNVSFATNASSPRRRAGDGNGSPRSVRFAAAATDTDSPSSLQQQPVTNRASVALVKPPSALRLLDEGPRSHTPTAQSEQRSAGGHAAMDSTSPTPISQVDRPAVGPSMSKDDDEIEMRPLAVPPASSPLHASTSAGGHTPGSHRSERLLSNVALVTSDSDDATSSASSATRGAPARPESGATPNAVLRPGQPASQRRFFDPSAEPPLPPLPGKR
jgi:hypothetical protein